MNTGEVIGIAVGGVGTLFGLNAYWHLWRWAKDCQGARIAIARKGRVRMQAPLVEWLLWSRQLSDKEEHGRIVYRDGGTTIAIVRRDKRTLRQRWKIRRARKSREDESRVSRLSRVTNGEEE